MMKDLSHCARIIYEHDRDRFLLSLFATGEGREALQAVYALNSELARIGDVVSEELIGHMRMSWWQERIEGLYEGKSTPGHPVLEALQPVVPHVPKEMLLGLVERYRRHSPLSNPPPQAGEGTVEEISLQLLRSLSPDSEPKWRKAQGIIKNHRRRYGRRWNGWMGFKLLVSSYNTMCMAR